MGSATQAMGSQQKQTTTIREEKSNFWDDLYKGARAISAGASAINGIADATGKGIELYDKLKIRSAYDDIAKAYGEGGYAALENNPDFQDFHHAQAMGQFARDRAQTQKGMQEQMERSEQMWDKVYQNWRDQAGALNAAWQKGDREAFMNGMEGLSATSPMPYRLKQDGNGNFKVLFRSDEAGDWVDTGRTMTPEETLAQMQGFMKGEQMVLRGADMKLAPTNKAWLAAAYRYQRATDMGNQINRMDPSKHIRLYDRNGQLAGVGIIQNRIDDYNAKPQILAYDLNGRQFGAFDGFPDIMQHGLSPFDGGEISAYHAKGSVRGGRAGGRIAGGGRRGGGGVSAGGQESGQGMASAQAGRLFKGSKDDLKLFDERAKDEITGKVDYGLSSFFEDFQKYSGLNGRALLAAFDKNLKQIQGEAQRRGLKLEQEEANQMAMAVMWKNEQQKQAASQQANGNVQPAQSSPDNKAQMAQSHEPPKTEQQKRILEAAAKGGKTASDKKSEKQNDLSEWAAEPVRKSQDAFLKGLQWMGNTLNSQPVDEEAFEDQYHGF